MTPQADDYTSSLTAEIDRIEKNPPEPPEGIERVVCIADPPHWPTYAAHVDGMYSAPCYICLLHGEKQRADRLWCELQHRRWKSWRVLGRITSWLYVLGITASGGDVSLFRCQFCGVERQYHAPRWRGERYYVLGAKRDTWRCLSRGHRRVESYYGMCTVCNPCPSCGSTDPAHDGDCGQEQS